MLSEKEIEGMRTVCKIAREVLDIGAKAIRPGITTDEIGKESIGFSAHVNQSSLSLSLDRIVHEATIERGAYPSTLNYYKFPKSLCT